jgi:hypothetical protein
MFLYKTMTLQQLEPAVEASFEAVKTISFTVSDESELTEDDVLDLEEIHSEEDLNSHLAYTSKLRRAHLAAFNGDDLALQEFMAEEKWDKEDENGRVPLEYAVENGHLSSVKLMLEHYEKKCKYTDDIEAAIATVHDILDLDLRGTEARAKVMEILDLLKQSKERLEERLKKILDDKLALENLFYARLRNSLSYFGPDEDFSY